jgi:Leucine-rich repeat (LRR) protein
MRGRATNLTGPGCLAALCGSLLLGLAGEAGAAIPASERAALIALYNSTNGAGWWYRTHWRNAQDADFAPAGTECTWEGVTCASGAHVEALELSWNGLQGPIPREIGDLTALVSLNLSDNDGLTGSIPVEIGNLLNLQYLDLWNHNGSGQLGEGQLSGPLPAEIGNLTNLKVLSVEGNRLSGPIPSAIGNLTQLSRLRAAHNRLGGPIPAEIGNCTRMVWLDLARNELTGPIPAGIGNWTQLEGLFLEENQLSGSIPPGIGGLAKLNYVFLENNRLSGPIPPELGSLPNTIQLYLDHNELSGPIPSTFGDFGYMEWLYLDHNQLSGPIPPELGALGYQFQGLRLDDNQLTGPIPDELAQATDLRELGLGHNQLTGPIPAWIGTFAKLWGLRLSGNTLTGPIPAELANLTELAELRLDGNELTGPIPAWIGDLPLGSLSLAHNQLGGPIPPELGKLTDVYELSLDDNPLGGSIPPELFNVKFGGSYIDSPPQTLDLSNDGLTGVIPPGVGNLKPLEVLRLNGNALRGPIPGGIGGLGNLVELNVSGNRLSGPIPATLAKLTGLAAGRSDLRWNALHTSDAALASFLDSKQAGGDWAGTQTVAPTGLAAAGATPDAVSLAWSPIAYTGDTGGYRLWYGTQAGGPYELFGTTGDKLVSASSVSGLSPGTTYHFALDTVTEPHAHNHSTVVSERTAEVTATTAAGGLGWFGLTVARLGPGTVSSAPGGIACGGVCSATYAPGTGVTLTAAPDAGSAFLGWSGACTGTDLACALTMDAARAVTASFSTPPTAFYTVTPCRAYDSRDGGAAGALAARADVAILVAGYCGIPETAAAVSVNVTVVSPTAGGNLRLYPSGTSRPGTSSLNYAAGQTRANNAVVSLGADGALVAYVGQPSGTTHVVVDVNGYFR